MEFVNGIIQLITYEKEEAMKVRSLIGVGMSLAVLAMFGCGGGGSPAATTVLSGMASKGPIRAGTVKVFAVRDGVQDSAPLAQGDTDAGGNYTIDVGSYKGAVVVEVTGGSYSDEVSGTTVNLKMPLRAVFADASTGRKTVAVTPLTELAYKKAKGDGPKLTAAVINAANASIAASFNLKDIVATLPELFAVGEDQKKYAAACGSFAQLVNDNKGPNETLDAALPRLLGLMGDEMEKSGGLSLANIGMMNDAITKFSNSGKNQSGSTIAPLPAPTGGFLKLSTSGNSATIGAIDVTVNLPAGVTVNANTATGEVTSGGVVTVTGVAAAGDNKLVSAKFTPGTPAQLHIALVNTTGFGLGEFVTIKFDLGAGGSFPANASAFSVAGFTASDPAGKPLGGITAAPVSVGAAN
jgi:hypothetical protein